MVKINGLFNDSDHLVTDMKGVFSIVEHQRDLAVSPLTAQAEFFMSKMGVRQKQALACMNGGNKRDHTGRRYAVDGRRCPCHDRYQRGGGLVGKDRQECRDK